MFLSIFFPLFLSVSFPLFLSVSFPLFLSVFFPVRARENGLVEVWLVMSWFQKLPTEKKEKLRCPFQAESDVVVGTTDLIEDEVAACSVPSPSVLVHGLVPGLSFRQIFRG